MVAQRNYSLDFMKFWAALMITNSHFVPLYKDVNIAFATFGAHGNALFFFVSGYLLLYGQERKTAPFCNWYKRRICRLWPAIFLWVIASAVIWDTQITVPKLLLASGYWFIQTIAVYYILFYPLGRLLLTHGKGVSAISFSIITLIVILCAFVLPKGVGSLFHTDYHYIYNFSIMMLGGITYRYREEIKISKCKDWILFLTSFVLYFVIQSYGKQANDWRWYTQLFALIPLMTFCFYGYKVCSETWCTLLMTNKVLKWPFVLVASLTLEIYIVQSGFLTDKYNSLFPLNLFIVFIEICIAAYLLRVITNIFLQLLNKDDWNFKMLFRI